MSAFARALAARFLAVALCLAPGAAVRADFVVVDYDSQTDWLAFDFVGWVRVEGSAPATGRPPGTAAVRLKVLEKLVGEDGATLLLEYRQVERDQNGEPLNADAHDWRADVGRSTEYLVFLTRQPNGAYACDDLRSFPVVGGQVRALPKSYEIFLGDGVVPPVRELLARVRQSVPGFRARVGQPEFVPPLQDGGRRLETPAQAFTQVMAALQEGRARDVEARCFSPGRLSTPRFRAYLEQQRAELAGCAVGWQAVLGDSGMIALVQSDHADVLVGVLYLSRKGGRWLLLNSVPDSDAARKQLDAVLAGPDFAALGALFRRAAAAGTWRRPVAP